MIDIIIISYSMHQLRIYKQLRHTPNKTSMRVTQYHESSGRTQDLGVTSYSPLRHTDYPSSPLYFTLIGTRYITFSFSLNIIFTRLNQFFTFFSDHLSRKMRCVMG